MVLGPAIDVGSRQVVLSKQEILQILCACIIKYHRMQKINMFILLHFVFLRHVPVCLFHYYLLGHGLLQHLV